MGPGTQELDAGLIAYLHSAAGQERHPAAQVSGLRTLPEIQLRAIRTQLILEMMDLPIILLADIAILRLNRFMKIWIIRHLLLLEIRRRKDIRR